MLAWVDVVDDLSGLEVDDEGFFADHLAWSETMAPELAAAVGRSVLAIDAIVDGVVTRQVGLDGVGAAPVTEVRASTSRLIRVPNGFSIRAFQTFSMFRIAEYFPRIGYSTTSSKSRRR